uniref:Tick transposon n=1 Tax=Gongylonema pulchrum TaxID=637853 RepID=A0A183DL61_9BILA
LCIPANVGCPQRTTTELNTFLSRQVHRRRKRRHSPTELSTTIKKKFLAHTDFK